MAYRPPIYKGNPIKSPQVSRQALIEALAQRLAALFGEDPPDQPSIPSGPLSSGQPQIPISPIHGFGGIPPRVPPRETPYPVPTQERQYVAPPSAWDWVRQPGFYDEDRSFGDRF